MKKIYFLLTALFVSTISSAQVVISQAYGGGGNAGSTFTHDFIELFNAGTTPVQLEGMAIHYAAATGTSWAKQDLPNFLLQPGQYFLTQQAQGSGGTTPLPTPDFIAANPFAMAAANFKIALTSDTEVLTGACPDLPSIVDQVGFGTANCFRGAVVPALSNTNAGIRLLNGCQNTNNNAADFVVGAPNPRNSSSAFNPCTNDPVIVVATPANNTLFAPGATVNVTINVSNFVVGNPGAGIDGHIRYTLTPGGSTQSKFDTAPIVFSGLASGVYTLNLELVNNNAQPLSPAVTTSVNFEIATIQVVPNLLAVRQDVLANGAGRFYQIQSQPVITYARSSRNQKFIQDGSAGILIDDIPGTISTEMVIGDAISGLKGRTHLQNGVLQLQPIENATVASSGTIINGEIVNIELLNDNIEAYESQLVQLADVSFPQANGTLLFTVASDFVLTDGQFSINLRTAFPEANYLVPTPLPVPQGNRNVRVLVSKFVSPQGAVTNQVLARSIEDLDTTLSTPQVGAIQGLKMYPNPANGLVYITSDANSTKEVTVFNMLGKSVIRTNVQSELNVSGLNKGVYMIQVTENSKTETLKLVIN